MKHLIRAVIFTAIGAVIFVMLNLVFQPVWVSWNNYSRTHDFYEQPRDTIETVFLGASIVTCDISPSQIYSEEGICSYNFGSEQQPVMASYFWLKETYRLHKNSLKQVVLETSLLRWMPERSFYHKALDWMRWSGVKLEVMQAFSELFDEPWWYQLPIGSYHDRWNQLGELDYDVLTNEIRENGTRGFYANHTLQEENYLESGTPEDKYYLPNCVYNPDAEEGELNEVALSYFEKIVAFCAENDLRLTLFRAPASNWNSSWHKAVERLADRNGLPFYDFNFYPLSDEISIYPLVDTKDLVHLNVYGAEKLSHWFAGYLSRECGATDVRGNPRYAFMDENLALYQSSVEAKTRLRTENDPAAYIAFASSLKNCATYIAVDDEASRRLTFEQRKSFRAQGLKELSRLGLQDSYLAVIVDGELIHEARADGPAGKGDASKTTGGSGREGNTAGEADGTAASGEADSAESTIAASEAGLAADSTAAAGEANLAADSTAAADEANLAADSTAAAGKTGSAAESTAAADAVNSAAETTASNFAAGSTAAAGEANLAADSTAAAGADNDASEKEEDGLPKQALYFDGELPGGHDYILRSCGTAENHLSSCLIDDEEQAVQKRGLNIVVYNYVTGKVIDSCCFDTYAAARRSADHAIRAQKLLTDETVEPSALDADTRRVYSYCLRCEDRKLLQLLQADLEETDLIRYLRTFMREKRFVIYLAVLDEATRALTEEIRLSLRELGLKTLSELGFRDSYIGVIDGGLVAYEQWDHGEEPISYSYTEHDRIISGGKKSGHTVSIEIDGREYARRRIGLNITVYDKLSGHVVDTTRFNTYAVEQRLPAAADEKELGSAAGTQQPEAAVSETVQEEVIE